MMMWTIVDNGSLGIVKNYVDIFLCLLLISFILFQLFQIFLHWYQSKSIVKNFEKSQKSSELIKKAYKEESRKGDKSKYCGENPIITTKINRFCKNGYAELTIRNDSRKKDSNMIKIAYSLNIEMTFNGKSKQRKIIKQLDPAKEQKVPYNIKNIEQILKNESELIVRISYNPVLHFLKTWVKDIFIIEVKENGKPRNKRHCEYDVPSIGVLDRLLDSMRDIPGIRVLLRVLLSILDCCPDDPKWWSDLIDTHDYLDKYRYYSEI